LPELAGPTLRTVLVWGAIWLAPLVALTILPGIPEAFSAMAAFFSKAAIVTFGGAYAVLAYVGQQAVEVHGWLRPGDMLVGLGLAETTPGPLILVLVFVGFLGGAREAGLDPLSGGLIGGSLALFFTFAPCFLWIFAGAPHIERLRSVKWLTAGLAAITAAVVGVISNLAVWFALHVLFESVGEVLERAIHPAGARSVEPQRRSARHRAGRGRGAAALSPQPVCGARRGNTCRDWRKLAGLKDLSRRGWTPIARQRCG
jgi:chromate transporter